MNHIKSSILILAIALCDLNESAAQGTQDYIQYHQDIIKAEQLITEERYPKALLIYEKVFDSYDFIFLRDYTIALQLAWYLGDKTKALNYLKLSVSNGWTIKDIKKNKFLKPLRKSDQWRTIKSQYDALHIDYSKSLNQVLRTEVHEMFKKDQKLALGALFRIGEKAQAKYAERKFAPHSEKQLARLNEMLNEDGYPGEKLIGNDLWMMVILSHHVSMTRDYTQKDTLYPSLKPRLLEAIRAGEMSPYQYAIVEDWYVAVKSGRKEATYGYLNTLTEQDLSKSNRMRRNIGMRSVETRNGLVDIQEKTGMDFHLQGKGWVKGKIEVANSR